MSVIYCGGSARFIRESRMACPSAPSTRLTPQEKRDELASHQRKFYAARAKYEARHPAPETMEQWAERVRKAHALFTNSR